MLDKKNEQAAKDAAAALDPVRALTSRAHDLAAVLDGLRQAMQTLKSTNNAMAAIRLLLKQAQTAAEMAQANADADPLALKSDFIEIMNQIDIFASNAGPAGMNLLKGDGLSIKLNEDGSLKLDVAGFAIDQHSMGMTHIAFDTAARTATSIMQMKAALDIIQQQSLTFTASLSKVQTRENFMLQLIKTLNDGAEKQGSVAEKDEGETLRALHMAQSSTPTALSAQVEKSTLRLL